MEWQDSLPTASELFPSLQSPAAAEGFHPTLPQPSAVFTFLQPETANGLKSQLLSVLKQFSSSPQNPCDSGATIDEKKGKVIVEATALIEVGAHLIGPCYIGPKAEIRHGAYVRGFSWICSEAVVGHASEIKHSVLLPGAKAPHFNYVGDSILGKGVNLGAGTKISNLRNDGGEVQLRIHGERVGSGLRKFGAILGEGGQFGCNSVTNPGVILGCNSVVWPNVTVTGVHAADSKHR